MQKVGRDDPLAADAGEGRRAASAGGLEAGVEALHLLPLCLLGVAVRVQRPAVVDVVRSPFPQRNAMVDLVGGV